MSLGEPDASSTQALEDIVAGTYQARLARVSALVVLLWDHGDLVLYLPPLYLAHHFLRSYLSRS